MASRPFFLCSILLLLLPLTSLAASSCNDEKLGKNRVFASCTKLPTLNATLHWTYDTASSSLSVAFTAPPAAPNGWVAWAINPTSTGMQGSQALVAFKESANGALGVKTYNITGYVPLSADSSMIAFNATHLEAESVADGKLRFFATLQLPAGTTVVNQVWQVGPSVTKGVPDKHPFAPDNLAAKGTLHLLGGGGGEAPAPAPEAGGPAPASGAGSKSSAEAVKPGAWRMVAGVLVGGVLMALV